uniref:Uncharacterized protein n=1 Tax=Arundo donax TaxID=35708 RepID=A0A0A9CYW2_ARUDO
MPAHKLRYYELPFPYTIMLFPFMGLKANFICSILLLMEISKAKV